MRCTTFGSAPEPSQIEAASSSNRTRTAFALTALHQTLAE
jgi:hypothetical protein